MTDADDYVTMLRESQLKRTTVIKDVDKIISENKQLKSEYEAECKRVDELEDSYWKEVEKNKKLKELLKETKSAISSALNFLACMDRISETECNEQLAFNVLSKCLEELEK